MSSTFWFPKSLKVLPNKVFIFIQQTLLTGKAYNDKIKSSDGQESSSEWLANNGAYYIYGVQRIDSVNNFTASGDQATVDVVVTEERTLYNSQGKIDQKNIAFPVRKRYIIDVEKFNQQRFDCATQVWELL
jgi:hypothetical protein